MLEYQFEDDKKVKLLRPYIHTFKRISKLP